MRWVFAALLVLGGVAGVWSYFDPPASSEEPGGTAVVPPPSTITTPAPSSSSTTSMPASTAVTTAAPSTSSPSVPVPVGVPAFPKRSPAPPAAGVPSGFDGRGIVTVAAGGADVFEDPAGAPIVRAREGLVFPATARNGEWIRVFTSCDVPGWVRAAEVAAVPPATRERIGAGFDFADAVIVIDPGHGGPNNIGAVGPTGLEEKKVNALIAQRVRDLLLESHVVDWETGTIYRGTEIPAAHTVILTRVGDDEAADYEAGLDFRAEIANRAGAHVMVSIHNNAGWELELEFPGSDVYYQSQDPVAVESRRLATLLTDEFQRSFAGFDAAWVGAEFVGAKSRLSPRDGESQYYGLLRRSDIPTVIAEGLYVSNPSEEALLRTPRGQQAYAEAVYRALVRFLTTDDTGGESTDPEVWEGFAGSGSAKPDCVIPSQDG
jgi:N-acetylmuramoyl-L-alanine amidase